MPSLIKQLMIDLSSNNSDSIVVLRIPIITVSGHHRYEGQQQPHPHPLHRHATFSLTTDIVEGLSTHVLRTIINLIKVIVHYYAVLAIVASHHHHDDAREIIIRNTRWCTKKIRRIGEITVHPHLRQCHLVIDKHCKKVEREHCNEFITTCLLHNKWVRRKSCLLRLLHPRRIDQRVVQDVVGVEVVHVQFILLS